MDCHKIIVAIEINTVYFYFCGIFQTAIDINAQVAVEKSVRIIAVADKSLGISQKTYPSPSIKNTMMMVVIVMMPKVRCTWFVFAMMRSWWWSWSVVMRTSSSINFWHFNRSASRILRSYLWHFNRSTPRILWSHTRHFNRTRTSRYRCRSCCRNLRTRT